MSKEIIYADKVLNLLIALIVVVILLFIAIAVISSVIKAHYAKKARKHEEEILRLKDECCKKVAEMPAYLDTEKEGQAEEREKIQKETEKLVKQEEKTKSKCKDLFEKIDKIAYNSCMGCTFSFIVIVVICSIVSTFSGGRIHEIKEVTDVNQNNVAVTAYYNVSYSGVDQETLTVFVKNDSKKAVYKATIVEKNTGASAIIENLDFGQEKITSIVVYPTEDSQYQFEVKDVEYYE